MAVMQPPNVNFATEGLNPDWSDDVLVALALQYQREHGDATVMLITQDGYPRIRAQAAGLRVESLPDTWKLPVEEDPVERENRLLKQQLQRVEAAVPVLDLRFAKDLGKSLRVTLHDPGPLSDVYIKDQLRPLEEQYPPAEAFSPRSSQEARPLEPRSGRDDSPIELSSLAALMKATSDPYDAKDVERYARERAAFLSGYSAYLQTQREYERRRQRSITLTVELVNSGSSPATDVDVLMHVPDGLFVSETSRLQAPEAPDPPQSPRTLVQLIRTGLSLPPLVDVQSMLAPRITARPEFYHTPNVSPLRIRKTDSYEITCQVLKLKHNFTLKLPSMYLTFVEGEPVRPFRIGYWIHAANVPTPVQGQLNVVANTA
jgi:hypothetical protein